jgi:hypothetical protein
MYPRALDEPDLKGYIDGINMDLINAVTLGGPGEYQGRAIGEAHARPSITGHAFDRVATPVVAMLRENGVDEDTVGHIADSLGPLRPQISPCSRSGIENPHGTEGARGPATAIASLVRKADERSASSSAIMAPIVQSAHRVGRVVDRAAGDSRIDRRVRPSSSYCQPHSPNSRSPNPWSSYRFGHRLRCRTVQYEPTSLMIEE